MRKICVNRKIFVPLHPQNRKHRGVEQLVARQAHNLEVARSNPASATTAAGRLLFFVVRAERESCLLSFRAWLRYKKSGRQF